VQGSILHGCHVFRRIPAETFFGAARIFLCRPKAGFSSSQDEFGLHFGVAHFLASAVCMQRTAPKFLLITPSYF
jgi:hypothetical protein